MHLLYLDDSGSTGNLQEEYFVLGGITVPEPSVRWLTHQLDELAESLWPQDPRMVEFHASDIFGGRGLVWGSFDRLKRKQVIKDVLCLLTKANPEVRVFACAVHKKSYPSEDPVKMAFEELSSRFDLYLQRLSTESSSARGLMILDDASYETSLQSLVQKFRDEGNRWGNQLRRLCEVPLFVDSRASRIIQLADHIAYAVFRRYNADDLVYFNCIETRFDESGGVIHGLAHRQTYNRNCTCPACITRRRPSTPPPPTQQAS